MVKLGDVLVMGWMVKALRREVRRDETLSASMRAAIAKQIDGMDSMREVMGTVVRRRLEKRQRRGKV